MYSIWFVQKLRASRNAGRVRAVRRPGEVVRSTIALPASRRTMRHDHQFSLAEPFAHARRRRRGDRDLRYEGRGVSLPYHCLSLSLCLSLSRAHSRRPSRRGGQGPTCRARLSLAFLSSLRICVCGARRDERTKIGSEGLSFVNLKKRKNPTLFVENPSKLFVSCSPLYGKSHKTRCETRRSRVRFARCVLNLNTRRRE